MAQIQRSNKTRQGERDIWDLCHFTKSCKSLKATKDKKAVQEILNFLLCCPRKSETRHPFMHNLVACLASATKGGELCATAGPGKSKFGF